MFMFLFACRMEQPKPKQTFLSCFLTCLLHDFLEEICVAGGTVLVLVCTSPDAASLKGGRVMCEGKFFIWHV